MRGLIYKTIKDLATKDPERTKEVLYQLKAKAESLTPEERQKLLSTANDLKVKAINLKDKAQSLTPEERQKMLDTANDLKAKAINLTDDRRAKITEAIRANSKKPE